MATSAGNGRKRGSQKALHVARAAAKEPFPFAPQAKGIAVQPASLRGNDIHMAGKNIAGFVGRADSGEEIGAVAFRAGKDTDVRSRSTAR